MENIKNAVLSKKIAVAAAMLLGAAVASPAFAQVSTSGGTITFTGAVNSGTCQVTGGAGTNGGTGNLTVALPTIQTSDLGGVGTTAGIKPFQLIFGGQTGCAASIGSLSFLPSSPQIDAITGNLINANATGATGVEIQLADASNAAINLASSPTYSGTAGTNGSGAQIFTYPFSAQYYQTAATVGAGTVQTSVLYNVAYN